MKKFNTNTIFLLIIALFFINGCDAKHIKQVSVNRIKCSADKQEGCARYLFLESWDTLKDEFYDKKMNKKKWNYWKDRYLNNIQTKQDAYVAIESMIESLDDPYTRFLKPEDFEDQNISIDAKICGIGVNITSIKGETVVVDVIEGTPAEEAKLEAGDIITKVNNIPIQGYKLRKVADIVRGEENTSVKLTILRDKKNISKTIMRKSFNIKSVNFEIMDNDVAYIKISSFISQDTAKEVADAIYKTQKAKGIILDLRGNHGGLLQNAVIIAAMFLDKGDIVSIVGKNKLKQTIPVEFVGLYTDKPLVVLINGASASASEILSGALKDHKRAHLVGNTTFGKGLVQKVVPLSQSSGVNVTVAKYLTPDGHDINEIGIEPDYKIKMTKEDFLSKEDPQLDKAKDVLNKQINSFAFAAD